MDQTKLKNYSVLGVGLAIIDYIATVDHYPEPDEKMRSQALECTGGGNCYNALSMLASMGVHTRIISKIGADPHGEKVLELCQQKNIDTRHVVIDENMNTAFSFVIADVAQGTRTIVHNPANELHVDNTIDSVMLDHTDLIYLDGRFTKAALRVAELAGTRTPSIPLLLDCERARSDEFEALRRQAQYLIASLNYIKSFMESVASDVQYPDSDREMMALERLLLDSNGARWVVLTLGSRGSLSLQKLSLDLGTSKEFMDWPGLEAVITSTNQMHLKDLIGADTTITSTEHYNRLSKFLSDATKRYTWKSYLVQYSPALHVETAGVGAGDKFIAGLAAGVLLNNSKSKLDAPYLALGTLVAALGLASITLDWSQVIREPIAV